MPASSSLQILRLHICGGELFIGDGPIVELEEELGYLLKARPSRAMAAVDSSLPQTYARYPC